LVAKDRRILNANPATQYITGKNPEVLIGAPFQELFAATEQDAVAQFIEKSSEGQVETHRFHLGIEGHRMTLLRLDAMNFPGIIDGHFALTVTGIDLSSQDSADHGLTDAIESIRLEFQRQVSLERERRYRAEEALRKSEERYAQAERIGRLGNWEWDLKNELITWSMQTYRIFNVDPADFQPSPESFMRMIYPADRMKVKKQLDMLTSIGLPMDVEFRFRGSDGDDRIAYMVGETRYDDFGNPNKLVGIVQDITERSRAQNDLRRREDEYISLVENSLTGIYIIQDGRVRFCNKRFAEMYGYTRSEILNLESRNLVPQEERQRIDRLRKLRLMGGDVPNQYEAKGLKKNGEILWVARRHTLITYKNKPAILGNAVDITVRKQMEDKLRRSEQALRFLSAQLLAAQESERKRISRELHDTIAQNLAGIKLSLCNQLEQIPPGNSGANSRELLEILIVAAETGIQEIRRIINNLRPPTIDDLGIVPTLSWHCREFQKLYPDLQVKLNIHLEEDDVPEPLKMVIFRLIQEAMNNVASHSGASRVKISLKKLVGKLELRIKDNGRGFDFQAALLPSSRKSGWGIIGMKERTELSNGAFSIARCPDGGTCVSCWWPV
jgi:PAS domain S-box-containing protein